MILRLLAHLCAETAKKKIYFLSLNLALEKIAKEPKNKIKRKAESLAYSFDFC